MPPRYLFEFDWVRLLWAVRNAQPYGGGSAFLVAGAYCHGVDRGKSHWL